ncbi:MAG: two-component system response regulator YehT [Deltaproteobacteria bacterium]|nr:MAG: two-component system response regulator YehT [Deltaproteobacteria bacterium]
MIRTVIVDDEQHARDELASLLNEAGGIDIVASCGNAVEAIRAINRLRPQALFLDIQMPVLDGFEMLGMIDDEIMPHVIFVTAYDSYALRAFEEKTLDYLLKPVEPERLAKALEKLRLVVQSGERPDISTEPLKRIPCAIGSRIKLVDPDEVDHAHSDLSGVHLYTGSGSFFTELTLKTLEQRTDLVRCHKSYLVNVACIDEIRLLDNGLAEIRTRGGQNLPVSRRYLRHLKDVLNI